MQGRDSMSLRHLPGPSTDHDSAAAQETFAEHGSSLLPLPSRYFSSVHPVCPCNTSPPCLTSYHCGNILARFFTSNSSRRALYHLHLPQDSPTVPQGLLIQAPSLQWVFLKCNLLTAYKRAIDAQVKHLNWTKRYQRNRKSLFPPILPVFSPRSNHPLAVSYTSSPILTEIFCACSSSWLVYSSPPCLGPRLESSHLGCGPVCLLAISPRAGLYHTYSKS